MPSLPCLRVPLIPRTGKIHATDRAVVAPFAAGTGYRRGMPAVSRRNGARARALLAIMCVGLAATACGSSAASSAVARNEPPGTASAVYPASLAYLNDKVVAPAFEKSTGQKYSGRVGAAGRLKAGRRTAGSGPGGSTPNIFQAVGDDTITPLLPDFAKWYIQYAQTSIVVAYNPKGRYASQFEAIATGRQPVQDLFSLMAQPGFRLGRPNPNTDPQGRAFIYMLELAQAKYQFPTDRLTKILGRGPLASADSPQIFDETSIDARLAAGQLDAASAYQAQAIQLHLRYITLPAEINLGVASLAHRYHRASITIAGNVTMHGSPLVIDITIVGKTDQAAADSFVAFVLSPGGLLLAKQAGYTLVTPTAFGDTRAIPRSIRTELNT